MYANRQLVEQVQTTKLDKLKQGNKQCCKGAGQILFVTGKWKGGYCMGEYKTKWFKRVILYISIKKMEECLGNNSEFQVIENPALHTLQFT